MTETTTPTQSGDSGATPPQPTRGALLQVPGVVALSLYLVMLAVVIMFGVVSGGHYPPVFLCFSVFLLAASGGLVLLFRWAWAMALAAVFLLASYNTWIFTMQHQIPAMVQGMLNMIFFLYLVRPEVREKLR